jgi:hypothetical protein
MRNYNKMKKGEYRKNVKYKNKKESSMGEKNKMEKKKKY